MVHRIFFVFLALVVNQHLFSQISLLQTDFEMGIPLNYTLINNDSNNPDPAVSEYTAAWISCVDPENSEDTVASSTSFFSPAGTADRWLITPSLNLGNYGNFLSWEAKSQDASYPDNYLVLVSTTDMSMGSFTDTIGFVQEENADWTTRQVDLSEAGYNGQTLYIAFVLTTEDGFKLYLDDILVSKEDPVNFKELSEHFIVYPNPANEILHISAPSPLIKVSVFSTDGRKVFESSESSLNISSLTNGHYVLTVCTDRGISSQKIVVQH
jgi:hypothetical protein